MSGVGTAGYLCIKENHGAEVRVNPQVASYTPAVHRHHDEPPSYHSLLCYSCRLSIAMVRVRQRELLDLDSVAMQASVTMGTSRMFRIFVVLGSAFMILLIIIYWDDVGASHLYLHTPVSPGPKIPHPAPQQRPQTSRTPSFLSDIDAFVNQFLEPGTGEPTDPAPADTS
ncbi:Carbohydrate sulfotransferase 12, partial [Nibea albiflora]